MTAEEIRAGLRKLQDDRQAALADCWCCPNPDGGLILHPSCPLHIGRGGQIIPNAERRRGAEEADDNAQLHHTPADP